MADKAAARAEKKQRRAERRAAEVKAQQRARRMTMVRRSLGVIVLVAATSAIVWAINNDAAVEIEASDDLTVLAAGEELFQANCAECHGADLRGTDSGPSFLSSVYNPNHHTDESFRRAVELGVAQHHWRFGNMEPVVGLSEEDVGSIIAFVREQQRVLGFES